MLAVLDAVFCGKKRKMVVLTCCSSAARFSSRASEPFVERLIHLKIFDQWPKTGFDLGCQLENSTKPFSQ